MPWCQKSKLAVVTPRAWITPRQFGNSRDEPQGDEEGLAGDGAAQPRQQPLGVAPPVGQASPQTAHLGLHGLGLGGLGLGVGRPAAQPAQRARGRLFGAGAAAGQQAGRRVGHAGEGGDEEGGRHGAPPVELRVALGRAHHVREEHAAVEHDLQQRAAPAADGVLGHLGHVDGAGDGDAAQGEAGQQARRVQPGGTARRQDEQPGEQEGRRQRQHGPLAAPPLKSASLHQTHVLHGHIAGSYKLNFYVLALKCTSVNHTEFTYKLLKYLHLA